MRRALDLNYFKVSNDQYDVYRPSCNADSTDVPPSSKGVKPHVLNMNGEHFDKVISDNFEMKINVKKFKMIAYIALFCEFRLLVFSAL